MAKKKFQPKSQEEIKKELDTLLDTSLNRIKEYSRDPKEMLEYAKFMSNIHNYSTTNLALIEEQFSGARAVASFNDWSKQGFRINKGEKGIEVYTYTPYTKFLDKNGNEKYLKAATKQEKEQIKKKELRSWKVDSFKKGHVYDVSQTNAQEKDLPKMFPNKVMDFNIENSYDIESLEKGITSIADTIGIEIKDMRDSAYQELGAARGAAVQYSDGSEEIVLNSRNSRTQNLATSIHELAHAKMHLNSNDGRSKPVKEFQAELTSYIVAYHFGMDTSEKAIPYIATWTRNGERLEPKEMRGLLEEVKKTSVSFIEQIDKEVIKEREIKQQERIIMSDNKYEGFVELLSSEAKKANLINVLEKLSVDEQKLFMQFGKVDLEEQDNELAYIELHGDYKAYEAAYSEVEEMALQKLSNEFSREAYNKVLNLYQQNVIVGMEEKFLEDYVKLTIEQKALLQQMNEEAKEDISNYFIEESDYTQYEKLNTMYNTFSEDEIIEVNTVYKAYFYTDVGEPGENEIHVDSLDYILKNKLAVNDLKEIIKEIELKTQEVQVESNEEKFSNVLETLSADEQKLFLQFGKASLERQENNLLYDKLQGDLIAYQAALGSSEALALHQLSRDYSQEEWDKVEKLHLDLENTMQSNVGELKEILNRFDPKIEEINFDSIEEKFLHEYNQLTSEQGNLLIQMASVSKEGLDNFYADYSTHKELDRLNGMKKDFTEKEYKEVSELYKKYIYEGTQTTPEGQIHVDLIEGKLKENQFNLNKKRLQNAFEELSSDNQELFVKMSRADSETLANNFSRFPEFDHNNELREIMKNYKKKEIDNVKKIYEEHIYNGMDLDNKDKIHVNKVGVILDRKEFVNDKAEFKHKIGKLTSDQKALMLQLNRSYMEQHDNKEKFPYLSDHDKRATKEKRAYEKMVTEFSENDSGKVMDMYYSSVKFIDATDLSGAISLKDADIILKNSVNTKEDMTLKNSFEADPVFEEDNSKLNKAFFENYETNQDDISFVDLERFESSIEAVADNRVVMNGVTIELPYYAANSEARTVISADNYYKDMINYYEKQSNNSFDEKISISDQTSEYEIGKNKLVLDHANQEVIYLDKYGVTDKKAKNNYSYETIDGNNEENRKFVEGFIQKSTDEFELETKQVLNISNGVSNSFNQDDFNIRSTESMSEVVMKECSYNLSDKAEIYYDKDQWSKEIERQSNESGNSFDTFNTLDDPREFYDSHKEEIEETISYIADEYNMDKEQLLNTNEDTTYEEAASLFAYKVALENAKSSISDFEIPTHPRLKKEEIVEPIVTRTNDFEMA